MDVFRTLKFTWCTVHELNLRSSRQRVVQQYVTWHIFYVKEYCGKTLNPKADADGQVNAFPGWITGKLWSALSIYKFSLCKIAYSFKCSIWITFELLTNTSWSKVNSWHWAPGALMFYLPKGTVNQYSNLYAFPMKQQTACLAGWNVANGKILPSPAPLRSCITGCLRAL